MTNLSIEQSTSSVENVTSQILEKLYQLAITSKVQNSNNNLTMSLVGNLQASSAFRDTVTYLRTKFPQLTINVQDSAYYIRFVDSAVENALKNEGYGDSSGITEYEAANIIIGQLFKNNTNITSFNEFSYFTAQQNVAFTFSGCTNLRSIDLSRLQSLKTNECFKNCDLRTITLGNIESIPNYAFQNNKNLTSINIPSSCKTLGSAAFNGCNNLSFSLSDLENIETIDGNRDTPTFGITGGYIQISYPDNNKSLYLPNLKDLSSDGGRMFEQQGMKDINLPGLQTLSGYGVFKDCKSLLTVTTLGNSRVTTGGMWYNQRGVFEGCTNLTTVNIPQTFTILPANMFQGCSSLSNLNIDLSQIKTIFAKVFRECSSLPKVMNFSNAIQIGHPLTNQEQSIFNNNYVSCNMMAASTSQQIFYLSSIKHIYLPKVKAVCAGIYGTLGMGMAPANGCFSGVFDLVYLRDIQSLGEGIFQDSNINTLIINNSTVPQMTVLSKSNYSGSQQWIYDRAEEQIPTHSTDLFARVTSIQNIYVPDSAVDAYKTCSYFSSQASVIKPLSQCPRKTLAEVENGEIGLIESYM